MWDKLRKQVALEREQLHRLLETHRSLLTRGVDTPPNAIELSALAGMLHPSTPVLRISSGESPLSSMAVRPAASSGTVNFWTP